MAWKGKRWTGSNVKENAPAVLYPVTANSKLAPVEMRPNGTSRLRPVAVGPFVSSTYVSIKATCPDTCSFKGNGCYVTEGFYKPVNEELDRAAEGLAANEVIRQEAIAIESFARWKKIGQVPQDGGKNGNRGRDLRLHVGGDCPNDDAAKRLALSARIWKAFGGGAVWTYTHNWRRIARESWGPDISVLASCETTREIAAARKRGYAPSIVVHALPGPNAYDFHGHKLIPCPAEATKDRERPITCVECRLCLDSEKLLKMNAVIGFGAHGISKHKIQIALDKKKVRRLTVLPT